MNTFTSILARFILLQNRFQQHFGHWVSWGLLSLVILSATVVILRYGFNEGSIALQETVLYNHALLFMLGMAYTLQQDKHVRVDVFYGNFSKARRAWIDFLGGLFFALPMLAFIIWASWDYVMMSWHIQEASAEAGGLGYVYLLKTVILIMSGLMSFQVLSMIAEAYLVIAHPDHDFHRLNEKDPSQVEGGV
ncbi:MAG: TRAP transporter small permease subunit [Hydrogenovibrio sp.]|nr:TRAP transporter small permease subunit [Hydrogenovibrio sp.]